MSASAFRAAEASSLTSAGPAGVAPHSAVTESSDVALPVVGTCWRGRYQIVEQLGDSAGEKTWRGTVVDGGQPVLLRAFHPAEPEARGQAWAKLGGVDSPHVQHARDAQRAGEWRVEIADMPRGVTLAAWRRSRDSVDTDTIKAIVMQITEALGAMHAFELVHLAVRPDAIYIAESPDLHCTVGGFEVMTSFDRTEPVPAAVDPLYAPPEAVGLNVHVAGPGLCAWDWWSLGRVAQELVLGRHVVAGSADGADLRSRAEALLYEADPKASRAGAVETMPAMDPQLTLLLRGLLTTAKEVRWTRDNIDRWVRGLPVKEQYATPRTETYFRWRGRPCTVAEMATFLQSAEHWSQNSAQLFEQTTPGTLAHFLRWSQSQSAAHEQLASAMELADSLPLKLSSPTAQRETVTMVALLQLSGGRLIWRGQPFEAATVSTMIQELGAADAVMVVRALSTRATALQIERIDNAAGRLLTEIGRTVGDVEGLLKRYSWIAPNDHDGAARLFRLAVEPMTALRSSREALASRFAGSDHPAAEKLFKSQACGRGELVALAWMASDAERFKFYTHAEADRRRAQALRARGSEIAAALTWVQFERALAVGRLVLDGWGTFFLAWMTVGLLALLVWPGPRGLGFAAAPLALAFVFRVAMAPQLRRALRSQLADATWSWRDGPVRCRRELKLAGHGMSKTALATEFANIREELSKLTHVKPAFEPLPDLPPFRSVRLVGMASWMVLVAFIGISGWRFTVQPPSIAAFKTAWMPPEATMTPEQKAKAAAEAALAKSEKEKSEGEVKIAWPYKPSDSPAKPLVRTTREANATQRTNVAELGRKIVKPFQPETIKTMIMLPVTSGAEVGVMFFDGAKGELINDQIYVLDFLPIPRTWVEVDGRKGVFLDL